MKYYDPRVEAKAHHICYMVGVNEGIQLSDKSRSDIFLTVRATADYWKADSDELRKLNHAKRWNELTHWLDRYALQAEVEDIFHIMKELNHGEYIRDYLPKYIK